MNWELFNEAAKEGIKAFVVVAAGIYVIASIIPFWIPREAFGLLRVGGVLFYDAHNLLATFNLHGSSIFTLFLNSPLTLIAMLLPPVALFCQGQVLSARSSHTNGIDLATRGAFVVVGYAPLALIGVPLLFETITVPDIVFTVLVYPLVFGGIGGISTKFLG